jgi:hypothetical protein
MRDSREVGRDGCDTSELAEADARAELEVQESKLRTELAVRNG